MLFSFAYTPYIAVIGDIVESKKLKNRNAVQETLRQVLAGINARHGGRIASKFMITLGDEFQGLLRAGDCAMEILDTIERGMYPTRLRFGIGVGGITTNIDPELPLGADGPAYYNARRMLEELKAAGKRKMESRHNIKIAIEQYEEVSELLNAVFSLNTALKARWTDRQREVIGAYLSCGGTQSEAAQRLGIHQSNVQKALASADFYTYQKAVGTVAKILSEIKERSENGAAL